MQSTNELISIGLPVYNGARYLREVLDSLLAQTYSHFELIISDNVSDDETADICRSYAQKDSRIWYIRQKQHVSMGENFDFVLKQSKGTYFLWVAHDDVWERTMLKECAQSLQQNPNAILVFFRFVYIDDAGKVIKSEDPERFFPFGKDRYSRLKRYLLLLHHDGKANLVYGLWRKKELVALSPLVLENYWISWGADSNFIFRALLKGECSFVDKVLFFKRMKPLPRSFIRKFPVKAIYPILLLGTPYFYRYLVDIFKAKNVKNFEKLKLIWFVFYAMGRSMLCSKV